MGEWAGPFVTRNCGDQAVSQEEYIPNPPCTLRHARAIQFRLVLTPLQPPAPPAPSQLRKIPNTSAHYTKARMAMAQIYLKHRKDKLAYIKCYKGLAVRGSAGPELQLGTSCPSFRVCMCVQVCVHFVFVCVQQMSLPNRDRRPSCPWVLRR